MGNDIRRDYPKPHVTITEEGEILLEWINPEARVLICIDDTKINDELDSPVYGIYTSDTDQELAPIFGQQDVIYFLNKLGLKPE
jgi:hypothetical protein